MFKIGDRVRIIGAPLSMGMIEAKTGTVIEGAGAVRVRLDNDKVYSCSALYFDNSALEYEKPGKVIPLPLPG